MGKLHRLLRMTVIVREESVHLPILLNSKENTNVFIALPLPSKSNCRGGKMTRDPLTRPKPDLLLVGLGMALAGIG